MKAAKKIFLILLLIVLCSLIGTNIWVVKSTEDQVYQRLEDVPVSSVGLVLGTSHRIAGGKPNPFFEKRMQTAAALYHSGKVEHFILSGDNRTQFYNEPQEMKKALLKMGVPDSAITLDYAGLRTLDSIVRSKEIFGQNKIVIITQTFHCYRAVFISKYYDIDAIAMMAGEPGEEHTFRIRLREYLARTKAVLDLYILKTEPRHLGEKQELNGQS